MRADYSFLKHEKEPPDIAAPLKIGIAPTPDFTLMSLAGFVEFLRLSSDESDFSRQIYCSWELLGATRDPIVASCGFGLIPTEVYGDPTTYHYVVVHGGILHGRTSYPKELYEFVLATVEAGVPLIGLCTGQFVLAELGMLDGRHCAVHFSLASAMAQKFPKVIVDTDSPVVTDGLFITCPGGLASINLAMRLVSDHCGRSRAQKAAHYLMADRGLEEFRKSDLVNELGLHCLDRRVTKAVGLMRQHMYQTYPVSKIAADVGTTERELTRLFRRHLRMPPARYWRQMRLKAAHWMVVNSDRAITQIAYECGFTDSSHMIHWFKREYSVTPAKLRKLHSDVGVH